MTADTIKVYVATCISSKENFIILRLKLKPTADSELKRILEGMHPN